MATTGMYVGTYNSGTGEIDWLTRYEYSTFVDLVVTDGLGSEEDTLSFSMMFPDSFISESGEELPLSGQLIRLVIEDVKMFEGIIPSISNAWMFSGTVITEPITCSSYAALMNKKHVVKQKMPEMSAGERVRRLVSEFGSDLFAGNFDYIEDGPIVKEESYDYQGLGSVITSVASQVGYMWYVDFDRAIHFFADLAAPAPTTSIDVDTESVIKNIDVVDDATGIANIIIIKDWSSRNENKTDHTVTADGQTAFFSLPMPPYSLEDTEVYVQPEGSGSWIEYSVVEDPLDGSDETVEGTKGTAYLCLFNWGVRFGTVDMPGAGDQVKTDYNAEEPDRVTIVFDPDSIQEFARREGSDGKHEMVVSASDFKVKDDGVITALGNMILKRKAWPVVTGSFVVETQNYGEWKPGQYLDIVSDKRGIFDLRTWVLSGYSTKVPVTVWVNTVARRFEQRNTGIWEIDTISFTSQPWD